jgi:RNA polymerase sigma factor (sigma-70 family)
MTSLNCKMETDFETALATEWPRLVRLCAWFSGSEEAAEDLAQDTLVAAWKSQEQLISLDKLKPWTSAIARNVCLNWRRGHIREEFFVVSSIDDRDEFWEEPQTETSLELELDRHELACLLDRALSLIPPETRQILIEHYIKESSHAEIAALMKLKPATVGVRLQRGKLTLQRMLQTSLKDEALAMGLIPQEGTKWEQTNIWCICCGQHRLLGKFKANEIFALRCPQCTPEADHIMVGMDLSQPYYASILGGIRKFKPAYSRLLKTLAPLYQRALQSHKACCPVCGSTLQVKTGYRPKHILEMDEARQILLYCTACSWASNKTVSGLFMALPEAQKFWREYPRLMILPVQEIEVQGSPAFLTRIQSVTSAAELTLISRQETFELLEIRSNIPL